MKNRLRRSGPAAACLVLLGVVGCGGGGAPSDGERAVLPSTYKAREKDISDGFANAVKTKGASKGRKARPSAAQPR